MEAIWFWDRKGTKEDQEQFSPSFCKIVPFSHGIKPNEQFKFSPVSQAALWPAVIEEALRVSMVLLLPLTGDILQVQGKALQSNFH